jgi:DNA-3-methyladenine glycosylase I
VDDACLTRHTSFDVATVAAMTERDIARLVTDAAIIRNRAKIQATVENAPAMTAAAPSLAALARSYESTRERAPRSLADLPASAPHADTFAKQLKSQGYRFVGPTSVYAFMQNDGVVNGCFRAEDHIQPHTTWERGARWSALRSWSTVLPWAGCSKLSRFGQLEADQPHTPCRCNVPLRAPAGRRRRGTPTLDRASVLRPHAISSATAARLALRSAA